MNELSTRQVSIMIVFLPLVFKLATLPSLLYDKAGPTAYILIAILVIIELLQMLLVLFVCNQGGMEGIKERYGSTVYRVISIPMLFVFAIKIILFLHEISTYVTSFLFYNSREFGSIMLILITALYIGIKGGRAIGRLFEVIVWIAPFVFLLGLFYGKLEFNEVHLNPLFNQNGDIYLDAIGKYLIYAFDFSPLLFMKVSIKKPTPIAISSVVCFISVVGCYILLYGVYGNASSYVHSAFSRLASFNSAVSETGSLDWPSGLLWITSGILNVALKIGGVSVIMDNFHMKKVGTTVFALIIAIIMYYLLRTFDTMLEFCTGGVQYAVVIIEIGLPILLLLLYMVKKIGSEKGVTCDVKSNG